MGRLLTVPTVTSDDDAHRVISPEQQMAHHSHAPAATARASFARARPHNARPVSYAARAAPDFRRESPPTCRESACGLARTSTRIPAHSPCVMGEISQQRPALTSQGVNLARQRAGNRLGHFCGGTVLTNSSVPAFTSTAAPIGRPTLCPHQECEQRRWEFEALGGLGRSSAWITIHSECRPCHPPRSIPYRLERWPPRKS